MEVILNDYVEHLGERGDVVSVKPGYARNYLYPHGLAYPNTGGNKRRFEQEQKRWENQELKRRGAAEAAARDLDGTVLTFERRAGETGVLFGSVTLHDVLKALDSKGFEIDRKKVNMDDTFKALGSHQVQVKIHRDLVVDIPVHVIRPGGSIEDLKAEAAAEVAEVVEAAAE